MAIRHTDLPEKKKGHIGEYNLAVQLCGFEDNRLNLWFGLDYLPGVSDVDVLLYHEAAGVFVIEVKAVGIGEIETFGLRSCKIKDRSLSAGPQYQASKARTELFSFLGPQLRRKLFISSTACWPRIERREWRERWEDPFVAEQLADKMLFKEDLFLDSATLIARLQFIRENPPAKAKPIWPFAHSAEVLQELIHTLNISSKQKPTPTDFERLKAIEDDVKKQAAKEAPPDETRLLLYRGGPGTGKTFRLLQIAYNHGIAGKRVLFCCYNRVLAADIRRLLSLSPALKSSSGKVEVYDIYGLLSHHATDEDFAAMAETHDEWARMIVESLQSDRDQVSKYDTILVDEAQDLRDWAFTLFEVQSTRATTVAVAVGFGQELYGSTSEWFTEFKAKAEIKRLNRNFRNTEPVFMLSQLFYEAYGKTEDKFEKTLQRFKERKPNEQMELLPELDRTGGSLPSLPCIDDSSVDAYLVDHSSLAEAQLELMVSECERIIEEELNNLTEQQRPMDVLILVPSEKSQQRLWITEALSRLNQPYLDYTAKQNRRFIAQPELVRVCTFHSSRGIEGHRVLAFGFEHLDNLPIDQGLSINNLGFIVLSRASLDLVLPYRSGATRKPIEFLQRCLVAISKARDAGQAAKQTVEPARRRTFQA